MEPESREVLYRKVWGADSGAAMAPQSLRVLLKCRVCCGRGYGNALPSRGTAPQTPMRRPLIRLCCKSKFKFPQEVVVQPHKSSPSALSLCPLRRSRDYRRSRLRGDGERYFRAAYSAHGKHHRNRGQAMEQCSWEDGIPANSSALPKTVGVGSARGSRVPAQKCPCRAEAGLG